MTNYAELIDNELNQIKDKLTILKKYNFKYDLYLEFYNHRTQSYQNVISNPKYNTNSLVQGNEDELKKEYDITHIVNKNITKVVDGFKIYDRVLEFNKDFKEKNYKEYLTTLLHDLNNYLMAIKEGYKESIESSEYIYRFIYKIIKLEFANDYSSLLYNLLEKENKLDRLNNFIEEDLNKFSYDKDVREMSRKRTTIKDKICLISLVENKMKKKIIDTFKSYYKDYDSDESKLRDISNTYNIRYNNIKEVRGDRRRTLKKIISKYLIFIVSIAVSINAQYYGHDSANKALAIKAQMVSTENNNDKLIGQDTIYELLATVALLSYIASIIGLNFSTRKILIGLIEGQDKESIVAIKLFTKELKNRLDEITITRDEYLEYYNEITEIENRINELYDQYHNFDYVLRKNNINKKKHHEIEIDTKLP